MILGRSRRSAAAIQLRTINCTEAVLLYYSCTRTAVHVGLVRIDSTVLVLVHVQYCTCSIVYTAVLFKVQLHLLLVGTANIISESIVHRP